MSMFKKMFKGGDSVSSETTLNPNDGKSIVFGRYTDCNKTKKQIEYWKKSVAKFSDKSYVDSFEAFINYLKDDSVGNVSLTRSGDVVEFEFLQGSKIIKGRGDSQSFYAESNLAQMDMNSIPVMRKLMAINYNLMYSKFALNGQKLCMKFSSQSIDASPNKLYAALKELCRKADQQDDLLVAEFSSLKAIDTENIIQLSEENQTIRYNYLIKLIKDCKTEIDKHNAQNFTGGIAYLLLNLTYQIDYLIIPQGNLTDSLERIHHIFFNKNSQASTIERNRDILAEYDKIIEASKEKICEGLYDVKCTFSLVNPANHKTVMDKIFDERSKLGWYQENNYPQIVEAMYSYMISYSFFNYGMVYPVTELLDLAMNVLNPTYYADCGKEKYIENSVLNKKSIVQFINSSMAKAKLDYPHVALNVGALNFLTLTGFIDSLIVEIDKMNLNKQ